MAQAINQSRVKRQTNFLTEKKESLHGETLGSLKCCVETSYTENAGSVGGEKTEITVHVYKNKIKVKHFLLFVQ